MEKFDRLYDFVNIMKVVCTFIAILYVLYWFICLSNIPFLEYIQLVFSPPVNLIKMFIKIEIPYADTIIDMIPLLVSLIFAMLYFLFQHFSNLVEEKERQYKLNVIAERKLEEKLVNENLKKIFENKTMEYTNFAILLILDITTTIDPNVSNIKSNIKELAAKNYTKIVNSMRKKYANCKAITPGKLFIVYNNFALFDDFFTDLLKEVKEISETNIEQNLKTNFIIAIDALKETDKMSNALDLLEKICTFNYSNRAIATPAFNVRYKINSNNSKYSLESLGISRFFEKTPDNVQTSVDFELFSLKNKRK